MKAIELKLKELAQREFDINQIYKMLRQTSIGMSWGINSPGKYNEQILFFKVQGFLHKGYVYVSLDFDDTFTITLTGIRNRVDIKKQIKGIYIEDLLNTIDRYVEKDCSDENYKEQIDTTYNLK